MSRSLVASLAALPALVLLAQVVFDDPWWTPDQKGERLLREGRFAEAARAFADPVRRALALHHAGDFEGAAGTLAGVPGAIAAYNRGNALVFLGRYEEAVESYDRALEQRSGWSEAEENRRIAALRIRGEQQVGEATEVGADDITFDRKRSEGGDEIQVTGGEELGDEALRALWLRNVQTRPGDFLRAKFAYQQAAAEEGSE